VARKIIVAAGFLLLNVPLPTPFLSAAEKAPSNASSGKVTGKKLTVADNTHDNSEQLIGKLAGLALVRDHAAKVKAGRISGLFVKDLPLLETEEFRKKMSVYIGKPLMRRDLIGMMKEIINYYRSKGRPIVDVITPEQDLTEGVLELIVLEGRIGRIRVEGNKWFNSNRLMEQIHARRGDEVFAPQIMKDLDWINRNPFREVDLMYVKGGALGQTDLVLQTEDRFPLRVYGGYENSGTALTGDDRYLAGFTWGNVFDWDGQFNYQFTGSHDLKGLRAHSASYTQPLPWRHVLTLTASYADTKASLPDPFGLKGFSWQTGARYEIPLPESESYRHSVTVGTDFKQSNNNLLFGGEQVFGTTTDLAQLSLGYDGGKRDSFGETNLHVTAYYSPGNLSHHNRDDVYDQSRFQAKAKYAYQKLDVNRVTRLPWDCSFINHLTYQHSNANLLPSEQLGFGGYSSIRGYDERDVNGDEGYILSNELRAPPFSIEKLFQVRKTNDQLQFLAFLDYGVAKNHTLLPDEKTNIVLMGAGPGMRYSIVRFLAIRADYGFQLRETGFGRRHPSRIHVGITLSY